MANIIPPAESQLVLRTSRLLLEPVQETHAREFWELFRDPELHRFVPFEPLSFEMQQDKCARWAKRLSPARDEIWLNWAARHIDSNRVIAHFQSGIRENGIASIGYLVAREFQNQGIASEGLRTIFNFLRETMAIREIKAWSDTRNIASHRLARKLGMKQVELIQNADFFKGGSSDEFVFSIKF